MEKDWIFRTDEYICDLRTVGVLVRSGKVLVQRDRDGSEYALPGGHVKIGETTADGLVREYDQIIEREWQKAKRRARIKTKAYRIYKELGYAMGLLFLIRGTEIITRHIT